MAESETPAARRRPLVRLGIFLISHSVLVRYVWFLMIDLYVFKSQFIDYWSEFNDSDGGFEFWIWIREYNGGLGCVSVVFCAAGILALLLLPVLAKNTYISENALMPGQFIRFLFFLFSFYSFLFRVNTRFRIFLEGGLDNSNVCSFSAWSFWTLNLVAENMEEMEIGWDFRWRIKINSTRSTKLTSSIRIVHVGWFIS